MASRVLLCIGMEGVDFSSLLTGVIGDGFGHIECGSVAANIVSAHFSFGDNASNGGFRTRGPFQFT